MQISPSIHTSLLDAVVSERPVFLWDASHHNAWVNSKALEVAGITNETPDPVGGEIVRDEDGVATGLLLEGAATQLYKMIPSLPQEAYLGLFRNLLPASLFALPSRQDRYHSEETRNLSFCGPEIPRFCRTQACGLGMTNKTSFWRQKCHFGSKFLKSHT